MSFNHFLKIGANWSIGLHSVSIFGIQRYLQKYSTHKIIITALFMYTELRDEKRQWAFTPNAQHACTVLTSRTFLLCCLWSKERQLQEYTQPLCHYTPHNYPTKHSTTIYTLLQYTICMWGMKNHGVITGGSLPIYCKYNKTNSKTNFGKHTHTHTILALKYSNKSNSLVNSKIWKIL